MGRLCSRDGPLICADQLSGAAATVVDAMRSHAGDRRVPWAVCGTLLKLIEAVSDASVGSAGHSAKEAVAASAEYFAQLPLLQPEDGVCWALVLHVDTNTYTNTNRIRSYKAPMKEHTELR